MNRQHGPAVSKAGTLFRACTESDLPAVQELVDALYESDPNTKQMRPNVAVTFKELTTKPEKGRLLVFEEQGRIVGYCIIIFFWSNEYAGDIIELDELFITEDRRGSGIGTAFIKWLEDTFADTLSGFSLQVGHHNKAARRLYERLGFSLSRNEHMIRILPHRFPRLK